MTSSPRVVVFGYSEVGCAGFDLLCRRHAHIVGVFTHQDDPGEVRWFRSLAALAAQGGVPVFTPASLAAPEWESLVCDRLRPDLIFSLYYRHLIPTRLFRTAGLGAVNLHGSLLPTYRGRAPVNWAVLHGETQTGATLHHMTGRADAGDIVDQEAVPIGARETAGEVMARVAEAAVRVLDRQFDNLVRGTAPRRPQDDARATYFGRRTPEDGRIDWSWTTRRIFNLVRAVTRPYPGAFADRPDGRRLIVWWAEPDARGGPPGTLLCAQPPVIATGDGAVRVTDFEWRVPPAASATAAR